MIVVAIFVCYTHILYKFCNVTGQCILAQMTLLPSARMDRGWDHEFKSTECMYNLPIKNGKNYNLTPYSLVLSQFSPQTFNYYIWLPKVWIIMKSLGFPSKWIDFSFYRKTFNYNLPTCGLALSQFSPTNFPIATYPLKFGLKWNRW